MVCVHLITPRPPACFLPMLELEPMPLRWNSGKELNIAIFLMLIYYNNKCSESEIFYILNVLPVVITGTNMSFCT